MENSLKDQLITITNSLSKDDTVEDVYDQLSLLNDIEVSESEEKYGQTLSQKEVEEQSTSIGTKEPLLAHKNLNIDT